MENDIWINQYEKKPPTSPIAIVGSPGLRSIGKLVVDRIIEQNKAVLAAELYSTHLPSIYETTPSYAAHPSLPGSGGAIIDAGIPDLPKVQFFMCDQPPMILIRGYHPNFDGQFAVAEKVVSTLKEMGVTQMIVVAGFGSKEKKIVCAANNKKALDDMKTKYDIGVGYKGPFMGFSGLVFGLAKLKDIEAVCLFAATEPKEDDLEFPDKEASDKAVELLNKMLNSKGQ